MMVDLSIARLSLGFEVLAGHEHRARTIAARAASQVGQRFAQAEHTSAEANQLAPGRVTVPPISIDLRLMGDDEAADRIATAVLQALGLKLDIQT